MDYLGKSKKKGAGDERTTPDWLFKILDGIFLFTTDVAATTKNTKCLHYITKEQNALDWSTQWGKRNFMNPPFSMLPDFTHHAHERTNEGKAIVVGIVPLDPTTQWWDSHIRDRAIVMPIPVRVNFGGGGSSNPLPIAVVVWSPLMARKAWFAGKKAASA